MMKKIYLLAVLMLMAMDTKAQQRYSDGLDDVLQYVPYATVYTLKACGVESRDDWKKLAITTVASWVATAGTGWVIKQAVKEWRPDNSDQKSFPSGHTSMAFCTATSLSLLYPYWYVVVPSMLWATSVGFSRLYLGVHYPTDVLTGALLGAGVAWVAYNVAQRIQEDNPMMPPNKAVVVPISFHF